MAGERVLTMNPLGTFRDNLIGLAILTVLVLAFLGGGLALAMGGTHLLSAASERSATTDATVTGEGGACQWHISYEVHEQAHSGSVSGEDTDYEGESYCAWEYDEGDTVTVHYDPDDPASHSVKDPSERRGAGIGMLVAGMLLTPIGVWLLYKGIQQGRGHY